MNKTTKQKLTKMMIDDVNYYTQMKDRITKYDLKELFDNTFKKKERDKFIAKLESYIDDGLSSLKQFIN